MSELEFWNDLGNIFESVMSYQKKNVEFNKRFINPWIRLGNPIGRQNQTAEAVEAYQRATEIDPDSPQSWNDLGDALFKTTEYTRAIDAYSKAVTLDPEAGWPLGNLALSMVMVGKIEEAVPLYKKSIDLLTEVKDKAICWNRLGNVYRKLNDYENAFLAFQTADRLDGENTGFMDSLDEIPAVAPVEVAQEANDAPAVVMEADESKEEAVSVASVAEVVKLESLPQAEVEQPAAVDPEEVSLASNSKMNVVDLDTTTADTPAEEFFPAMAPAVEEPVLDVESALEPVVDEVASESSVSQQKLEGPLESPAVEVGLLKEENVVALETAPQADGEKDGTDQEAALSEPVVPTAAVEDEGEDEESPLNLFEKKINLVQIIESVIAKVEKAYAENKKSSLLAKEETEPVSTSENGPVEEPTSGTEDSTRVPEWLVINHPWGEKTEEPAAQSGEQPEMQVEAVSTFTEIPQEAAVNESAVNMDVVETFTDQIPANAVEALQGDLAVVERETIGLENATEGQEETVQEVVEEHPAEFAYEEYLKDMEDANRSMTNLAQETLHEEPVTQVSKNGEVRIAMDTNNAHVWNELGNIYFNKGTLDEAIESYSKAIELDRSFAWPYSNLALAYVQKGRYVEAILLYQRGIELFSSDKDKAITWNRLGNVYRRINDYSHAIASYQTADELDPDTATLTLRSSFGLLGNAHSESKPACVS